MASTQLSVRHLSKTFPGARVLRNVDIDINPGEIHALVGANGSGKSTFIKILAGVYTPDPGYEAWVRGERFELGSVAAADQAGLRFVHQDLGLVPSLDVADNIALGRGFATKRSGRINWKAQRERARVALAELGHDINVRSLVGDLRSSQRTAIAIARSLLGWQGNATVLVLDEPTASMPQPEVDALFEVVSRVRDMGVSVIYVSHHLDEVFAVADRVTVLRDGAIVGTNLVEDLTHDQLVTMMVGAVDFDAGTARVQELGEAVLEVQGLSTDVITRLDFSLHKGEVLGFAGITGSGRTEVAPALFGSKARKGSVRLDGREIPQQRPDIAVAGGMGLVPADRHAEGVISGMTVLENLTLADLLPYWKRLLFRRSAESADGQQWIEALSVKPNSLAPEISTLSGGNQQKIVIGRWMRISPRVLLLDEPTQGIDVRSKAEIHALIDKAVGEGMSVIVCSSDEHELCRLSHRVLVLYGGRVAVELTGSDITEPAITHISLGGSWEFEAAAANRDQDGGVR